MTIVDELSSSEGEDEMDTSETEEKTVLNGRSNGATEMSSSVVGQNGVDTSSGGSGMNRVETRATSVNGGMDATLSVHNGSGEMMAAATGGVNGSEHNCCRSDYEADMGEPYYKNFLSFSVFPVLILLFSLFLVYSSVSLVLLLLISLFLGLLTKIKKNKY